MRYLTKSRFKLAMECPTKLFYTGKDAEYKNSKDENEFLMSLADGGFQVGKMAMLLYPEGIEVNAKCNQDAIAETETLLQLHDSIVLFEPAFVFEGLLVRVDIFVKKGDFVELIEVKAKSYDSSKPNIQGSRAPIKSEIRPYIEDVAFQKYVVANALATCTISTFLMLPDKSSKATTDGLNQCFGILERNGSKEVTYTADAVQQVRDNRSLLAKVPIDEYVDIVMSDDLEYPGSKNHHQNRLPERVKIWSAKYQSDEKIAPYIHKNCSKCEFKADRKDIRKSGYHECLHEATGISHDAIDQGTVLDIWRYRKKDELLAQGIHKIKDTINFFQAGPFSDGLNYTQRQMLQVAGIPRQHDKGGFYFDADYFRHIKKGWRYPYHFIDFETCAVALPFFKDMHPYENIAFQFSHHILHEDGTSKHHNQALITQPGVFPNFEFVRQLKQSIGLDAGTIFRWATHENTVLNIIKKQLENIPNAPPDKSELIDFIISITNSSKRSMIDLNDIALKCYFHPETQARTSIKRVLPAVLKTSDILREEYTKPIGAVSNSLNFPSSFVWFREIDEVVMDPYELLKMHSTEVFKANGPHDMSLENLKVAEGGAAAMAYARLQFETMNESERQLIEEALLRYCELDTLAMLMILKAWIAWS
ncbi:DUF2779 domain-containing protein [Alphaproteobacteria bacterium]|nr:DUF2779 domain-containing protein [Alphaproteobacteria bacterium]